MAGLSSIGERNWFVSSSLQRDGGSSGSSRTKKLVLGCELLQPFVGGSRCCLFAGQSLAQSPLLHCSSKNIKGRSKGTVTMVIPFARGDASTQPPPDLPSYLFHNRIVFLGMSLVPAVTELIMAEFLYLQYVDAEKPIYMYINSTGTTKDGEKLGYETEALAMYDTMQYVKPPIFTLCVGNAWGEAALLLAAGAKGNRSALPSTTIMLKEIELLERHTGQPADKLEEDIRRPKYFNPDQAVDYGIIDKVLRTEKGERSKGVVDQLRKAQLIS